MKLVARVMLPVLLGMGLSGCGTTSTLDWENNATKTIDGTLAYRERMPLPPHAVVSVALEDVSRMDGAAVVLRKKTFNSEGKQVPLPFQLTYDPSKINPKHQYALRARIEVDGKLRFTNDSRVAVITDRQKTHEVDIQLKAVGKR